ncbi:MAG: D-alanine--D-alanine ligase [Gammaproteobacteria bacterium]|nr:D-alanine--D-alanine ligase [Gammaproteobacteria bacterium]MDP2346443.1 D-alanine--D-alanine ligase [Gammaproteobacteria bacterium]
MGSSEHIEKLTPATIHCTQPSADWVPATRSGTQIGFFEFWPTWLMYFPVILDWLRLSIRHRSLTLPLLANPLLPVSGMVGVAKSELMRQAVGRCRQAILPWIGHIVDDTPAAAQAHLCIVQARSHGITFPFVCKPDIGCRGSGVKLVHDLQQLQHIIEKYPVGAALLCQKLASCEPEAGVFYVRDPETGVGEIVSLTFKFSPWVRGDGSRTLAELVADDERAGELLHLYRERHHAHWNRVLNADEKFRLVFSASHCRGAVFQDARCHITPALTEAVHAILSDLPGYHYGRLDVKFPDIESLRQGKGIEIVELNGASSESIHIWDKETKLTDAIKTLLWQYRTLFRLGAYQRKQGLKPPGLGALIRHWKIERQLTRHYPETD